MRLLYSLSILPILLFLGCAAPSKPFQESDVLSQHESYVCVFRVWRYANGAASNAIYIDDKRVAVIKNGTYACVATSPGRKKISIHGTALVSGDTKESEGEAYATVAPGAPVYLELSYVPQQITPFYVAFGLRPNLVPSAEAQAKMATLERTGI